ncbi:MAG: type III-A CRISPR-associated RAMP protein Csm5 [Veillonellaceae bacterium]|nr:type III-A CRISPR-associated RAMP protein Csm5 [Veillonellaceae bacterium]
MMRYWEMELDVCTPLFIGSGEKITKLDYVYQSSNWMVYMLDEAKWASFLKRARLMNDFTSKVEALGKRFSLDSYLKNHRELAARLHTSDIVMELKRRGVFHEGIPAYVTGKNPNDIVTFARNGLGERYIPGSSLKGAFRTAILAYVLLNIDRTKCYNKLEHATRNAVDETMDDVEKYLGIRIDKDGKYDMVNSRFKGLTVSDAKLINETAAIVQKWDLSLTKSQSEKKPKYLPIYREAIVPATKAVFTIGIDGSERGMGEIGVKTAGNLLHALSVFRNLQYKTYKEAIDKVYKGSVDHSVFRYLDELNEANLVLGGGTGYISKTLIYPIAGSREKGKSIARKILSEQFDRPGRKDDIISPHTLKLTKSNDMHMMGLCNIKVVKEL